MKVQGAAISLSGKNFAIVLVSTEVATNAGEADMAIESMQPMFGGAPVVLMAQKEDGSPIYYGDQNLLSMLADLSIEKLPWQEYSV